MGTQVVSWDMSSALSIFAQPQQALVKNILAHFYAVDAKDFWSVIMCTIEEGSQLATFTNPIKFTIVFFAPFLSSKKLKNLFSYLILTQTIP